MVAKKMRVEVLDESGNRYTITFEGKVTREKALRLLDIIELLGGVHDRQGFSGFMAKTSKFDKTKRVVEKHFPLTYFSSKEVLEAYEEEFKEPISLSTVSTYLARMTGRGVLRKRGPAHKRQYLLLTGLMQKAFTS